MSLIPGQLKWPSQFSNAFRFTRLLNYSASIPFSIETENYQLKTAESLKELFALFKLRYNTFLGHDRKSKNPFNLDIDEHDLTCDHMIIIDKRTKKLCGTYRVQTSDACESFYSEQEFELKKFLELPGKKMELGRACILPEYRKGSVIELLWQGIAYYIKHSRSRFLFGCSSIHTLAPKEIEQWESYFHMLGKDCDFLGISPRPLYQKHWTRDELNSLSVPDEIDERAMKKKLPPLLRTYLHAGALIIPTPAIDRDFHCVDFFTIVDMEKLNPLFRRKFMDKGPRD